MKLYGIFAIDNTDYENPFKYREKVLWRIYNNKAYAKNDMPYFQKSNEYYDFKMEEIKIKREQTNKIYARGWFNKSDNELHTVDFVLKYIPPKKHDWAMWFCVEVGIKDGDKKCEEKLIKEFEKYKKSNQREKL